MSLNRKSMAKLIRSIENEPGFAQALLDEGLDCFVKGESPLANLVLKNRLFQEIETLEVSDVMTIMAEARREIEKKREFR